MCSIGLVLLFASCVPGWRSTPRSQAAPNSLFNYSWTWTDEHGDRVTFSQWRGTPLVVAAVYTSCEDTCPRTIAKLREIYHRFGLEHRRAEFVLVSMDPHPDTPAQLRDYKTSKELPEPWHLLTGDHRAVEQLTDVLGIHVMEMESHTVHDARITVFDGAGRSDASLDVL